MEKEEWRKKNKKKEEEEKEEDSDDKGGKEGGDIVLLKPIVTHTTIWPSILKWSFNKFARAGSQLQLYWLLEKYLSNS